MDLEADTTTPPNPNRVMAWTPPPKVGWTTATRPGTPLGHTHHPIPIISIQSFPWA